MSRAPRAIRPWTGSSLVFAAELLLLPTGLITAGYLTRQLGAVDYGLLTLSATVVGWLQWVANSTLARAAHRLVAGTRAWRPVAAEVVRLHAQVGLAMAAALLLLAEPLSRALQQPAITTPLRVLAADVLIYALACGYRNVLIGTSDHAAWAAATAARWLTRLAAIVLFVHWGWSVMGAVCGMMVANMAELLVGRWRVGSLERAAASESATIRRALLSVVAPVALAAIAMRTFDRADLLLLSMLGTSAASLGHYGAAQNLTVIVSLVASSVSPAILAAVTSLRSAGDEAGARRVAFDALGLPFLVLPFTVLAAASAPEILRTIYGAGFDAAALPFGVLMLAAAMLLVVSVATGLLVAADRGWLVVVIAVPMLTALVMFALLLVPRYGSVGAALASLGAATGGAVASLVIATRAVPVAYPWRAMLVGGALSVPVWLAAQAWSVNGATATIVKLVLLALAVLLSLLAAGEGRYFRTTRASSTTSGYT